MTILPPKYSTATVAPLRASIMTGIMAIIFMPTSRPACMSASLERLNFRRSWSSRTKAFTTRTPIKFSCKTLFRPSMRFCMTSNNLVHTFISTAITPTITGMTTSSTSASRAFRARAMDMAAASITGARTSIRRPIASIMVIAFTSLVIRVMRDAEEKRSMSANEKSWILLNRH